MINENEKKYVYIVFSIIVIVLIVVLFFIWSPMFTRGTSFSKKITSTSFYTDDDYLNESIEKYKYIAKNIINEENYESIKELINSEYLNNNELNEDNVFEYLKNNNILTHVSNSTIIYSCGVKQNGKTYVFSYKYYVNDEEKMVHIIEDYYGKYTVSFDQHKFPIINKEGFLVEKDGISFKIIPIDSFENSLVLSIDVMNSTTEEYIFEFNSIKDSNVIYKDSNIGYLNTAVVGTETSNIVSKPGSSVNFKLSYNIPIDRQCDITEIDFNKIKRNNGDENIISLFL